MKHLKKVSVKKQGCFRYLRCFLVHFFTTAVFVYPPSELQCLDINRGVNSKVSFMEIKMLVLLQKQVGEEKSREM